MAPKPDGALRAPQAQSTRVARHFSNSFWTASGYCSWQGIEVLRVGSRPPRRGSRDIGGPSGVVLHRLPFLPLEGPRPLAAVLGSSLLSTGSSQAVARKPAPPETWRPSAYSDGRPRQRSGRRQRWLEQWPCWLRRRLQVVGPRLGPVLRLARWWTRWSTPASPSLLWGSRA